MARCIVLLLIAGILGCRTPGYDRIPATTVDNPDPLLGGAAKPRTSTDSAVAANPTKPAESAPVAAPSGTPAAPTAMRTPSQPDRIGPLTVSPPPKAALQQPEANGISPGTAALTLGVKEPISEASDAAQQSRSANQGIQPAGSVIPASNPEVVQGYRRQLNEKGAVGLRTKQLEAAKWEAIAHFPTPGQPDQLRRIEAQGTTEADALSAIVDQLAKGK